LGYRHWRSSVVNMVSRRDKEWLDSFSKRYERIESILRSLGWMETIEPVETSYGMSLENNRWISTEFHK